MPLQHSFRDGRFSDGRLRNHSGARRPATNPFLDHVMRRTVVFGALLVIALPAARGSSHLLGALPLWLVGMPLASWWALHRFRLPLPWLPARLDAGSLQAGAVRRRAGRPQARRWAPVARLRPRGIPRVA